MTASPSIRHQRVLTRLLVHLHTHLRKQATGQVFPAPSDGFLSEFDVVVPDLLVLTSATSGQITAANIQGAPDLIVEILSPSTASRDRVLKRKLYEKIGVQEYRMVDPDSQAVEVWRLASGGLEPIERLASEDALTSPLIPGLDIPGLSLAPSRAHGPVPGPGAALRAFPARLRRALSASPRLPASLR